MTKEMGQKDFKPSPLGPIPEDWEVVRLGEVAQIRNGSRPIFKGNGNIPVYGSNGIMGWTDKHNVSGSLTLVIGRVGASGEVHLAKGNIWVSDNALFLILNPSEVSSEFLYYMLLKKNLRNLAAQSTHPLITQTTLKNLSIPLPPLPEQKRIAEVLLTVDEAIFKVEEEIEHTERLKRGLMQHLLTRGIGHTQFKDSPIGKIPEDWEVVRLGKIGMLKNGARPDFVKNGNVPVYGANGVMGWTNKSIANVEEGTLVIGRVGASGEVHLVIGNAWISDNAMYFASIDWTKVDLRYLFFCLVKKNLKKLAAQSTHPIITQTALKNFPIPLPPLPEQKKISEILMAVDRKLDLLRQKKYHLQRLKKGLMNGLLTGRRRLKVERKNESLF